MLTSVDHLLDGLWGYVAANRSAEPFDFAQGRRSRQSLPYGLSHLTLVLTPSTICGIKDRHSRDRSSQPTHKCVLYRS